MVPARDPLEPRVLTIDLRMSVASVRANGMRTRMGTLLRIGGGQVSWQDQRRRRAEQTYGQGGALQVRGTELG